MNNLGLYKTMTTFAKKVGGPVNFLILVGAGGYGVFRLGEAGIKKIVKIAKQHKQKKVLTDPHFYVVHTKSEGDGGITLNAGDTFKVLETDGDAVLIEVIGDNNNPYFVSAQFLLTISNYNPN